MCRVLSYLGKPIVVSELLYEPDNSFVKQSYRPKYMTQLLNLAGFGIAAWDPTSFEASLPYLYKTPHLPFYDENLRNLADKIAPTCILAHVRGVSYTERQIVSSQNVHPFMFDDSKIALAHNGVLAHFEEMKFDLLEYILPEYQKKIHGTTDSEWIYAVFLSQLKRTTNIYETEDIIHAVIETFKIIQLVRNKHNIAITSPVNLFITDGNFIATTRFVFDYGWQPDDIHTSTHFAYHSLWYTFGESYGCYDHEYRMRGSNKKTIIIASEPLTEDTTTWIEVPEYTLIVARQEFGEIKIVSRDINI